MCGMEMGRLQAEISDSPSESSSSSSASFSRTSAGRVIAIAGDGSSIIISNPVELRSAIAIQLGQTAPVQVLAGQRACCGSDQLVEREGRAGRLLVAYRMQM